MLIQVIEDYATSPEDLYQHALNLQEFVKNSSGVIVPLNFEKTCHIAEVAFQRLSNLELKTKKILVEVLELVSSIHPIQSCREDKTKKSYEQVIQLVIRSGCLEDGLIAVNQLLSPIYLLCDSCLNQLETAKKLMQFGLYYFSYLPSETQQCFLNTQTLLKNELPYPWLKEQIYAPFYQFLKTIFKQPIVTGHQASIQHTSTYLKQTEKHSKKMWPSKNEEPLDEFCEILYNHEQEHLIVYQNETKIKQAQLQFICNVSQRILNVYMPFMIRDPLLCSINGQLLQDFQKYYPPIAYQLFFRDFKDVALSKQESDLLGNIFQQITLFFSHLNQKKIEKKLYNPSVLNECLYQEIKDIFLKLIENQYPGQIHVNQSFNILASAAGALSALSFIHFLLKPEIVCFMVDHLLIKGHLFNKNDMTPEKSPALNAFPTQPQLSCKLSDLLVNLGIELAKIGHPTGFGKVVVKICLEILKNYKLKLAEKIQQTFGMLKSSSSTIALFQILEQMLLKSDEKGEDKPLFHFFDPTQHQQLKEKIKIELFECSYPHIVAELKKQSKWSLLCTQSTSVEEFYKQLVQGVWDIFQDEAHLKILTFYCLQGVRKTLHFT